MADAADDDMDVAKKVTKENADECVQELKEAFVGFHGRARGGMGLLLHNYRWVAARGKEMIDLKGVKGWTYERLALELGVSEEKISQWVKLALFPFLRVRTLSGWAAGRPWAISLKYMQTHEYIHVHTH